MKLTAKNITLENVKKSKYWDLIAILIWNHYSEERYQDNSCIEIEETYYGKGNGVSSWGACWDNPEYKDERFERTLDSVIIIFKRDDYITYIYIHTDGNIKCFGEYTDKEKSRPPYYSGGQRSLDITNWMLDNGFIEIVK